MKIFLVILCSKSYYFEDILTLCHPGGGGGPKDPQLSKLLNALKWVHKNGWNVFDFSYIDLKKISNQKF